MELRTFHPYQKHTQVQAQHVLNPTSNLCVYIISWLCV